MLNQTKWNCVSFLKEILSIKEKRIGNGHNDGGSWWRPFRQLRKNDHGDNENKLFILLFNELHENFKFSNSNGKNSEVLRKTTH